MADSSRISPTRFGRRRFGFVDLFSGAGGMSCGFARHPAFHLLAAADAEIGKPSTRAGTLQCNATYAANMGIAPARLDLSAVRPDELRGRLGIGAAKVHVLSVCPPCTGFSRANPQNHLRDDRRNSLSRPRQPRGLQHQTVQHDIGINQHSHDQRRCLALMRVSQASLSSTTLFADPPHFCTKPVAFRGSAVASSTTTCPFPAATR